MEGPYPSHLLRWLFPPWESCHMPPLWAQSRVYPTETSSLHLYYTLSSIWLVGGSPLCLEKVREWPSLCVSLQPLRWGHLTSQTCCPEARTLLSSRCRGLGGQSKDGAESELEPKVCPTMMLGRCSWNCPRTFPSLPWAWLNDHPLYLLEGNTQGAEGSPENVVSASHAQWGKLRVFGTVFSFLGMSINNFCWK